MKTTSFPSSKLGWPSVVLRVVNRDSKIFLVPLLLLPGCTLIIWTNNSIIINIINIIIIIINIINIINIIMIIFFFSIIVIIYLNISVGSGVWVIPHDDDSQIWIATRHFFSFLFPREVFSYDVSITLFLCVFMVLFTGSSLHRLISKKGCWLAIPLILTNGP